MVGCYNQRGLELADKPEAVSFLAQLLTELPLALEKMQAFPSQ
jgi:hypothetical protein